MSNNQHKNKARNQLRHVYIGGSRTTLDSHWFRLRTKRKRIRDAIAKKSRKRNRCKP